jgi:hypothetical protein
MNDHFLLRGSLSADAEQKHHCTGDLRNFPAEILGEISDAHSCNLPRVGHTKILRLMSQGESTNGFVPNYARNYMEQISEQQGFQITRNM